MFSDINKIDIRDLYNELQAINNKLDFIINQNRQSTIISVKNPTQRFYEIPDACRNCPNYPENGGSGNCNCTLCDPKITC